VLSMYVRSSRQISALQWRPLLASSMASTTILSIPSEVTEYALTFCSLTAIASFSQTCRQAYTLVYESPDQYLWRQLFLLYPFDDPRKLESHDGSHCPIDWKAELQRRIKAEAFAFSPGGRSPEERTQALRTFVETLHAAPPFLKGHEPSPSHNITWLTGVLRDSRILESPRLQLTPLLARLRAYFTLLSSTTAFPPWKYTKSRRIIARCRVYDVRNYSRENKWGPYLDGGRRVDWMHMDAVVHVVHGNLNELPGPRVRRRPPGGLEATRSYSAPGVLERDPRDWAGVAGTWRRYVCFMDYGDLYAFNFSPGLHDSTLFSHPSFHEATRLIDIKFTLIDRAELRAKALANGSAQFWDDAVNSDADGASGLEVDSSINAKFPPYYYSGATRGNDASQATVTGRVHMGPDGSVRWQFTTLYDGRTEWCSEGVQIGNVGSAAGVAGVWTGVNHNLGDPVGPFWLWKVDDNHLADQMDFN